VRIVLVTISLALGMEACFKNADSKAGINTGKSNGKANIKQESIMNVDMYCLSGLLLSVPVLRFFFSLYTSFIKPTHRHTYTGLIPGD
jgi:hypothetical protein